MAAAVWLAPCADRIVSAAPVERASETRRQMGVPWTITVFARDRAAGSAAIAAGFAEIARLERVLSDYDPESELARLSARAGAAEPTAVGDDLWRVLEAAEGFREQTQGAFDISVGPLTTLWRQARRSGRLPRADKLAAARATVGAGAVELVTERRTARLPRPGTRLDPGGIGMGYAADRAMLVLTELGIAAALIEASGDILVSGPPPETAGWRIAVAPLAPGSDPEMLTLSHVAVTTSGDAYQAVEIDGVRYSHIVDPRTGLGVRGSSAVTVVAADATTADALATAASVLGPDEGPAILAGFADVSFRYAWQGRSGIEVRTGGGWPGRGGR
jgi:thiamine biosynthesis lipoprotein